MADNADVDISYARTPEDLDQIRALFREFISYVAREHSIDLGYQQTERELRELPASYAEPRGCLLLARRAGRVLGCVALRPLGADVCELKRMYVRPEFQGQGIGRMLGLRVIDEARQRGYHRMHLDTADTMAGPQHLYESLGFRRCAPYYEAPADLAPRVVFMERPLS